MPSRNIVKTYLQNGYYHIYNRGVEKRAIFTSEEDGLVFLYYLKEYLSPCDKERLLSVVNNRSENGYARDKANKALHRKNYSEEIDLLAFCLMPNHVHLLIKQRTERSIEHFMRSLCTRYARYFNKSHSDRVGGLFQDAYKAVHVGTEEQLLHLSRYIHRNPILQGDSLEASTWPSSYVNYLGKISQPWVKTEEILNCFAKSGVNSYQAFVEGKEFEEESVDRISTLMIDEDGL